MNSKQTWRLGWMTAALVGVISASALAQHGAPDNGEWPTYGGDLGSTKYSPLDQVTGTISATLKSPGDGRQPMAFSD